MIELLIVLIFTSIAYGYLWWKQRHQYWEKCRIPHVKSESLLYGNLRDVCLGKVSRVDNDRRLYNALAPHRFGGVYLYSNPVLYVRDPELIKRVMIKDFRHFHDRNTDRLNMHDPLSLHLFFLDGRNWDMLRRKLTPTFTSGKMKMLFELVAAGAEALEKVVEVTADNQETVDIKKLMLRYATDVISSCAFGLEVNSLQGTDSEFFERVKEIPAPSLRKRLFDLVLYTSPTLRRILRICRSSKRTRDFFINLIDDTVKYRKENGVVRNDFLQLIMNLKEEEDEVKENYDFSLVAQCFLFFIAGYESSSSSLSFTLYEIADNPDVQKKLQEEVDRVLQLHGGKITYNSLNEMPYMDKVFNETSRLFQSLPFIERLCTEDYRFPGSNFVLKKGVTVHIPVIGLHTDPQYFPNPDVFNPENFSEEAKRSRPACTFLPFGEGPRNCIGMRFGVTQVKLALAMIMRKYNVTISHQMKVPMDMNPQSMVTVPKDPILLNFHKRGE